MKGIVFAGERKIELLQVGARVELGGAFEVGRGLGR